MAVLEAVRAFLTGDGWPVEDVEGQPALQTRFKGESGVWICMVWVDEERQLLSFYSMWPELIDAERREAVALYATRVNFGAAVGDLELSMAGGELRYRTSADVEGLDPLPDVFVKNLIHGNVLAFDALHAKIRAVAAGALSPAEAAGDLSLDLGQL